MKARDLSSHDPDDHRKSYAINFADIDGPMPASLLGAKACAPGKSPQCHIDMATVGEAEDRMHKPILAMSGPLKGFNMDWESCTFDAFGTVAAPTQGPLLTQICRA
jgi:hypothetical protein